MGFGKDAFRNESKNEPRKGSLLYLAEKYLWLVLLQTSSVVKSFHHVVGVQEKFVM